MVINVSSPPARLELGRQGENAVTQFDFDISAWTAEYGAGTLLLNAQRNEDTEPYPVTLDGETWLVSAADTAYEGYGQAQLVYTVNEQVKKSIIFSTRVFPSIEATAPPPDPYETWYDEIVAAKGEAEEAAEASQHYAEEAAASAAAAAEYKLTFTDDNGNIVIARSE